MPEPKRPNLRFNAQEERVERALLADLKDAIKFAKVYPKRLAEARQNLCELYDLVIARHRKK